MSLSDGMGCGQLCFSVVIGDSDIKEDVCYPQVTTRNGKYGYTTAKYLGVVVLAVVVLHICPGTVIMPLTPSHSSQKSVTVTHSHCFDYPPMSMRYSASQTKVEPTNEFSSEKRFL